MKEQLFINNTEVELLKSLNPNLTFNIADISDPDKRKSDFSKTITLPGSKTINELFEYIFNINIDLQTFNPNVKADCLYLVDSEIQIDGYLQLKEIIINDKNNITYKVVIFGRLGNFVADLGNKELDDSTMLWGNLDHTYTLANQQASWSSTTGYVYPIIDYGFNTGLFDWWVEEMLPAVFAKEYIDRMFSAAGYSYTSNFLTSDPFTKLIIPCNGKTFGLSSSSINQRIFKANTPLFDTVGVDEVEAPPPDSGSPFQVSSLSLVRCTNEVYDAGNVHDPTTGMFTCTENGTYDFQFDASLQGSFYGHPTLATRPVTTLGGYMVMAKLNSAGTATTILDALDFSIYLDPFSVIPAGTTVTTNASPTYPDAQYAQNVIYNVYNYNGNPIYRSIENGLPNSSGVPTNPALPREFNPPNKYVLNANGITCSVGEKVYVYMTYAKFPHKQVPAVLPYDVGPQEGNNANFVSTVFVPVTQYTYHPGIVKLKMLNATFKNKVSNPIYNEGNNINMFDAIPKKIKQKDFFMSIVKMFNLYVQTDESDDNKLIIEPRDDFYNNNVNDWTQKLDNSKDLKFLPMGALESSSYIYSYKEDKDYYNQLYNSTWNEIYGEKIKNIDNDFLTKEHKTSVIFSPTPSVGQDFDDKILPTIKKFEDGAEIRTQSNIRILYYGGLKNSIFGWYHQSNLVADQYETSYPYAGHYDDPFTPTLDINFGLTKEIYWDNVFNAITITDNNLYNKYHKKFIEEISDINSKIVEGYFYLTPSDIKNLSFKELYYFENQYFRLNKVENYNPSNPITKCEFLKLNEADVFVPNNVVINGGFSLLAGANVPVFSSGVSQSTNNNSIGNKKIEVSGEYNYVNRTAENVEIMGDNNKVFADTRNITIDGSGNTVIAGLKNVVLINTYNKTVTSSNVTYINGEIKGDGSVQTVSSSITATEIVTTYIGDTSTGNITIIIPSGTTTGKIYNFKKISASNTLQIRGAGGETIDGLGTLNITGLNHSYTLQYDGEKFIII